jgi:hypothetical protein
LATVFYFSSIVPLYLFLKFYILQELSMLISRPLQSKTFSHRYLAGVLSLLWFSFNLALSVFTIYLALLTNKTSHYCNTRSSIVIAGVKHDVEHRDIDFNILNADAYYCAFVFPCFIHSKLGSWVGLCILLLVVRMKLTFWIGNALDIIMC